MAKVISPSPIFDSPKPTLLPPRLPPVVTPPPFETAAPMIGDDETEQRRQAGFWLVTAIPSGLLSAVIHLIFLIVLGLCMYRAQFGAEAISIEIVQSEKPLEEELELLTVAIEPADVTSASLPDDALWKSDVFETPEPPTPVAPIIPAVSLGEIGKVAAGPALFTTGGSTDSEEFGKGLASRAQLRRRALANGATAESENAVQMALEWIVRHQRQDGSWCFNHRQGPQHCDDCRCGNPGGRSQALSGATAMGLLPLLGAGYTHLDGPYREQIARGLHFLIERQQADGSFFESGGRMYSHGLATLAVCEALAMTRQEYYRRESSDLAANLADDAVSEDDERSTQPYFYGSASAPTIHLATLTHAAQQGLRFIEKAQHRRGGWRYQPNQAGDTSVVGWQMMALKSGYLAELDVDPKTIKRAVKFLDYVANDRIGSAYGYTSGGGNPRADATSAIGLLCRMYTGWERRRKGIRVGVRRIGNSARPSQGLYFYYYATQVMHHHRGPPWQAWNGWMRDYLVKTQSRQGSETGSWQLTGRHDNAGRLYCASMAAMTLEVYYRYSPIYGEAAVANNSNFQ